VGTQGCDGTVEPWRSGDFSGEIRSRHWGPLAPAAGS
jgi:hypothetical protein